MDYITSCHSPLGDIRLASDGQNLTGLWLEGQKYFASTLSENQKQADNLPVFTAAKQWLKSYFAGQKPDVSRLPLLPAGSPFRQQVWKLLLEIPYGEVTTYGEIAGTVAARTGRASMSAQAVGGAVGHNPISIIIPCHRVVGADGGLTGYAGGTGKKLQLLTMENADLSHFRLFHFK